VRREARTARHQQDAQAQLKLSWWSTRFPFNPLLLLSAAVVVIVFIALPIYIYSRSTPECPSSTPAPPSGPTHRLLVHFG